MTQDLKVRENRARRMADRQGLRLIKSRSRDPNAIDFGLYALVDVQTNGVVNEPIAGRWVCSWELDEIEEYLAPSGDGTPRPQAAADGGKNEDV